MSPQNLHGSTHLRLQHTCQKAWCHRARKLPNLYSTTCASACVPVLFCQSLGSNGKGVCVLCRPAQLHGSDPCIEFAEIASNGSSSSGSGGQWPVLSAAHSSGTGIHGWTVGFRWLCSNPYHQDRQHELMRDVGPVQPRAPLGNCPHPGQLRRQHQQCSPVGSEGPTHWQIHA